MAIADLYINVGGHTLYLALEPHYYTYMAADGSVHRSAVDVLESMHDEAGTRLIFHVQFVAEHCDDSPQIVVCSSDTDVFILLVLHATHLEAILWMDTGVSSRNTGHVQRLPNWLGAFSIFFHYFSILMAISIFFAGVTSNKRRRCEMVKKVHLKKTFFQSNW